MSALPETPPHAADAPFTTAHARADHWGMAAKGCLEGVAAAAASANLGFLYASEDFAADLPSILTFLRETTRIEHWVGAAMPGVMAGREEMREGGALAVMVGWVPPEQFRCFTTFDTTTLRYRNGPWLAAASPCVGLVHGDPRNPALPAMVEQASHDAGFLVGGVASGLGAPSQLAGTVCSGGLSGLLLGKEAEVVSGLSQGCAPIGPVHVVTEAWEGVLMGLDGQPALEVLKEEAGELIARDLKRAAGYIHLALPIQGSDGDDHSGRGDYSVRNLLGIDPRQGWLAVGHKLAVGDKMMFVRRDANGARQDLEHMLADVAGRLDGRPVRAGIYVSCTARGRYMFGEDGAEIGIIQDALGDVPLLGCFANGEISAGRLYGYTGVLTLLTGARP